MSAVTGSAHLARGSGPVSEIHRYRDEDLDRAIEFRVRAYGAESPVSTPEYIDWQFGAGEAGDHARSALWLHTTDGVVDGEVAGLATTLRVDDEDIRANWLAEWVVDGDKRGHGAGRQLLDAVTADAPVTMSIKVSDRAQRILRDTGWTDLGDAPLYVHPIDSVAVARRRGLSALAVGAWAFGVVLRAVDAAAGWVLRRLGVRLDEIDRFDHRADEVWTRAPASGAVIGRRDAASLNRRYVDSPERDRYRRFYVTRRSSAVGYVVLSMGEHGGVEAGWLVDFLSATAWTLPLLFLVNRFFRSCGRQAVYCLSTRRALRRHFAAAGYLRRSSGWRLLVDARELPARQRRLVSDQGRWSVTVGDSNLYPPRGADPT